MRKQNICIMMHPVNELLKAGSQLTPLYGETTVWPQCDHFVTTVFNSERIDHVNRWNVWFAAGSNPGYHPHVTALSWNENGIWSNLTARQQHTEKYRTNFREEVY